MTEMDLDVELLAMASDQLQISEEENEPEKADDSKQIRFTRRRASLKPKFDVNPSNNAYIPKTKSILDIERDHKALKKIYLSKKVKTANPSLETIFEAPNDQKVMSGRKFKRSISFQPLQRCRTKKRPLKAKHLISSYKKCKKNKVTMEALMEKLSNVEEDSDA